MAEAHFIPGHGAGHIIDAANAGISTGFTLAEGGKALWTARRGGGMKRFKR